MTEPEPYPRQFVGKRCSFNHGGKRLVGIVQKQAYIGRTERGRIPNYRLEVRGISGAVLEVDLVETYATITDL
jgi:hypothetical protein